VIAELCTTTQNAKDLGRREERTEQDNPTVIPAKMLEQFGLRRHSVDVDAPRFVAAVPLESQRKGAGMRG
jgi:hypothetical protein